MTNESVSGKPLPGESLPGESLPWDEAALRRLEVIPVFVRSMAKGKIEKAARTAGETRVTVEFMDANKARLMG